MTISVQEAELLAADAFKRSNLMQDISGRKLHAKVFLPSPRDGVHVVWLLLDISLQDFRLLAPKQRASVLTPGGLPVAKCSVDIISGECDVEMVLAQPLLQADAAAPRGLS